MNVRILNRSVFATLVSARAGDAAKTATGPNGNIAGSQQSGSDNPATKTDVRCGGTRLANGNCTGFGPKIQAGGHGNTRNAERTSRHRPSAGTRRTMTRAVGPAH